MRHLFSNLVVILLGLLGAIAKWGGLVMDIIGLPEAGSQLDKWISRFEIGDGAYIIIVGSVVLLLIINGPALRRAVLKPIISAELEMTVPKIGDFTPVCSIRITNTGPPLESKCSVQVEKHKLENHMPDPLVVRTDGQLRNNRTGPFTLRAGQQKLVPILFRFPGRINEFLFIGEGNNHYSFIGDSAEFEVAIYGAKHATRISVRLNVSEDWKVHAEMEYC